MELRIRSFAELSNTELYEILKARVDVFVVEQKCPYPEIDDIDYVAEHLFYCADDGKILAYLRAYWLEENIAKLGRVLTVNRGNGLGRAILKEGIRYVREEMKAQKIVIEAQSYALGFYEKEGFEVISEEFLEDGIPHRKMELVL